MDEHYSIREAKDGKRWQQADEGYVLYREGIEDYLITGVRLTAGEKPWLCKECPQDEETETTEGTEDDGEHHNR